MTLEKTKQTQLLGRLMMHLLPIQVLLAALGFVNGTVSSLFAGNAIGATALGAVGLYSPISMFITAVSTLLMGGSTVLGGKYMGQDQQERMQGVFSLDLLAALIVGAVLTALHLVLGSLDMTGMFSGDPEIRFHLNRYLLGMAVGVLPLLLGVQTASFLSLENRTARITASGVVMAAANGLFTYLLVVRVKLGAFGLALAGSLSNWCFFLMTASYFFSKRAFLRFTLRRAAWDELGEMAKIGLAGAASNGYQTVRGCVVNSLLFGFVGGAAISAFSACSSFLTLFWALPVGMLAVSRMLISISCGEADRQSLTDVMRIMMRRYVPLMTLVALALAALAVPLTRLYYRDPSDPVYGMTVWGFRLLPLCMPLSTIYMHFVCLGEVIGRHRLVHILSALDGVVCVAGFTALLIPSMGIFSLYIANFLNGVVTTIVIVAYGWKRSGRFPRTMDLLLALPPDFGAPPEARMDLSLHSMEEVVSVSGRVQEFCLSRGIDIRRASLSALFLEEMAGNVVTHGFEKDKKKHSVDIRVVCREEEIILRIRDDCVPFDPFDRRRIIEDKNPFANIGIKMVFRIASDVQYQSILGLNVLTIRI